MKYRKLTDTGDYSFGHNMQDFLSDADAVAQAIKTNLKLLKGEWWEDTSKGFPLFQNVLRNNGSEKSLAAVDLIIKDAISSTLNVKNIDSYVRSFDSETRIYTITSCTVNTKFGTVTVSDLTL